MGLWDGYPGENAWDTASSVTPAFQPVEPPAQGAWEPSSAPDTVPKKPLQSITAYARQPQQTFDSRPGGPKLARITSPSGAPFSVNAEHGERFSAFLRDLEDAGYPVNSKASGGYNYRNIAGTNRLSKHAHGNAIDINWDENPRGGMGKIPPDVARSLAKKHGLIWGGDWKNPDPMHFEIPVPGEPGHTYGDGHNHGAPPATATASPGPVASASPRSKPMADNSGGFFSFLNKPMSVFSDPENADILARAGPQGYQPIDGDAFLKKHGLANTPGAKEMLAISNMQRELMSGALKPPQATWGQGIGELLKGVGATLTSRVDPKLAMTMAGSVGQSHREQQELVKKMQMQALLQQAQGLGGNLADVIKDRIASQYKKEELAAGNEGVDRAYAAARGLPVSPSSGGVATAGMPSGAVAREAIPALPSATAAPDVPGTVLGTPPPGLMSTPPAGVIPAAPGAIPSAAPGNAPTTNAAPTVAQQPATAAVPDEQATEQEIKALRAAANQASRLGLKDRATNLMEQAKSLQESLKERRTGDINEYLFYVSQMTAKGEKPVSLFDWQKEIKAAGRNMVTIDQRMETEEAKKIGAGAGERANKTIERGEGATSKLQSLAMIQALQDRISTGRLGNVRLSAAQWANELGVHPKALESFGIDKNFAGDAQAFQSQANRMVIDMLGSGGFPSNNFSNADRDFLTSTLPQLTNDPRGNKIMLEFAKRAAERDIEKAQAWAEAKERGMNYDKFSLEWTKKIQNEHLSGDLRAQAEAILGNASTPTTGATSAPLPKPLSAEDHAKLKPGDRYIDPTGTVRVKK